MSSIRFSAVMFGVLVAPNALADPMTAAITEALTDSLAGLFGRESGDERSANGRFLPVDEAFSLPYAEFEDTGILVVRWRIADGYALYRGRFRFAPEAGQGVKLGPAEIPRGTYRDEGDGLEPVEVLYGDVAITLPVIFHDRPRTGSESSREGGTPGLPHTTAAPGRETTWRLTVGYQGCAEAGFCYEPMMKELRVDFP